MEYEFLLKKKDSAECQDRDVGVRSSKSQKTNEQQENVSFYTKNKSNGTCVEADELFLETASRFKKNNENTCNKAGVAQQLFLILKNQSEQKRTT